VGDHDSERILGARLDGRPADSEKRTGLRGLKVGAKRSFLRGREVLDAVAVGAGILKGFGRDWSVLWQHGGKLEINDGWRNVEAWRAQECCSKLNFSDCRFWKSRT